MDRTRTVIGNATRVLTGLIVLGAVVTLASCYSLGGGEDLAAYASYSEYEEGGFGPVAASPAPMAAARGRLPAAG